jgi:cyclophilin family peptidyl-prolyl cis-trans isomerase
MPTTKRDRQRANRQARLEAALAAQARAKRRRQVLRIGVVAAIVVAILAAIAFWPSGNDQEVSTTDTPVSSTSAATASSPVPAPTAAPGAGFAYGTGECPPAGGVTEPRRTFSASPQLCIDPAKTYAAVITTSVGTIRARLDTQRTPGTTNNFVTLARWGYYDGTKLFRTDTSIGIIQGGGQSNTQNPGYLIPDEGGKFAYTPGDLVMARSALPNSAGGQFFFAVDEKTANLDQQGTYVTFGKVTEGMDVLQKILASHKAGPGGANGEPDPIPIVESVRIEES